MIEITLYILGSLMAIISYDSLCAYHHSVCDDEDCHRWELFSWNWTFYVLFWPIPAGFYGMQTIIHYIKVSLKENKDA